MLTNHGPRERHWRMARNQEFDVCEFNVGAYLMSRDRDEALTAIPVFLHRRFRHGFAFINVNSGIKMPKDSWGGESVVPIFSRPVIFGYGAFWKSSTAYRTEKSPGSLIAKKMLSLRRRMDCALK